MVMWIGVHRLRDAAVDGEIALLIPLKTQGAYEMQRGVGGIRNNCLPNARENAFGGRLVTCANEEWRDLANTNRQEPRTGCRKMARHAQREPAGKRFMITPLQHSGIYWAVQPTCEGVLHVMREPLT
jgi:hypothetical protein